MTKTQEPKKTAALLLESGRIYFGESFGAQVERCGEIVFNTSMTGYQEILTDPSYKGQIIVMTAPHIGNVGTNAEDAESQKVFAEGLVVRETSRASSSWRAREALQSFLSSRKIPAVSGLDTRALTKHIREAGAMRAILSTLDLDPESLLEKVKASPDMNGKDLVREVTCGKPCEWNQPEWKWGYSGDTLLNSPELSRVSPEFKVVVMDFGAKQNILRCLKERNCLCTVVPAQTKAEEILALKPDGIMLSNGPGDPAAVTYAIETIRSLIQMQSDSKIAPLPIFGICLGHQLLGLALGGRTFKLKFGHRGANHPVKDMKTGKIEITTQNHGFCVDINSLPEKDVQITHVNLNDGTLEGLRHKKLPLFSVQYHPESSAGPHDSRYLFDRFTDLMQSHSKEHERKVPPPSVDKEAAKKKG